MEMQQVLGTFSYFSSCYVATFFCIYFIFFGAKVLNMILLLLVQVVRFLFGQFATDLAKLLPWDF